MQDFFTHFFQQITETPPLEWIATLAGFLSVYLAARQNIWTWPTTIISVSTYLYIFFVNDLYGNSVLQIYFLGTAFYGWYYWNKRSRSAEKPISSLNKKQTALTVGIILLLGSCFGFVLQRWTDSNVPYIDGFCTAMSLVAQFLMTRKILQSWIIWVVVDICYIPLYFYKDLAMTTILYVVFTIIAWKGYLDWKRTYISANAKKISKVESLKV